MIKFKKSEIVKVANKITNNSELFGDEVDSVVFQLSELSNAANKYGFDLEGEISSMWGQTVKVIAIPNYYKHAWSF